MWRPRHALVGSERARETGMWLVRADVTGERDANRIALGPTCVIDPAGRILAQVPVGAVGMAVGDVGPG